MSLFTKIKELLRNILMRSLSAVFIKKQNEVIFCSFHGKQYSDNPRAISEYLHTTKPDCAITWIIDKNAKTDMIPEYITIINKKTIKEHIHLARAKVWVYNNDLPFGTYKSKKQFYIQTWHGDRGFKFIRYDALREMGTNYHKIKLCEKNICNLAVAGSDEGEKKYRTAFDYKGEILKVGCPRNDRLVNLDNKEILTIKHRLGITKEKILLYAPTFRDEYKTNQRVYIDFDLIKKTLEQTTNKKWIILIRGHSLTKRISFENGTEIIDVSNYYDMADLLLISDILISDFSSTVNDYALLNRPIILYLKDYDDYIERNRKLKYDARNIGYPTAYNMTQLIMIIEKLNDYNFSQICQRVLNLYGTNETGQASKEVCQKIISFIEGEIHKQDV